MYKMVMLPVFSFCDACFRLHRRLVATLTEQKITDGRNSASIGKKDCNFTVRCLNLAITTTKHYQLVLLVYGELRDVKPRSAKPDRLHTGVASAEQHGLVL